MLTIQNNKYSGEFNLPDHFNVNFELDAFQKHAINCMNRNEDVLITAHTGSGKTIPAEYAISKALNNNKSVIYTAPIKTLSNQKYKDFSEKFGNHNIGIITGDIKNNPDAPCLIMTTEILRNMLYRQNNGLVSKNPFDINIDMNEVESVIFDEVHYINDRDRGTVWEESIIMLDPKINLIMLSATIDDADKFAQWIAEIKNKKISLLSTDKRPVPLQHYLFTDDLYKILDADENFLHDNFNEAHTKYRKMITKRFNYKHLLITNVNYLKEREQLPATYFVLNRKNCSVFANLLPQYLITPEEATLSINLFNKYLSKYKDKYEDTYQYKETIKLLSKGIAIHHSGLIPILKESIEMIYSQGLIKVLFATETFAAGVNMPTKTVVFTQLTKFDGSRRVFNTDEYKQMAGRAGRRGMDDYGTVIQLPLYEFIEKEATRNMMIGKTSSIKSKFDINYKFVLKMLSCFSDKEDMINNILKIANKSYLSKQNSSLCVPVLEKIGVTQEELNKLGEFKNEEVKIMEEYHELSELVNSGTQFGIRIHPKVLKKYRKNIETIEQNNKDLIELYKKSYSQYIETKNKLVTLQNDKDYYESIFRYQIEMILNFLKDNNYVDNDYKLTPLGIIAKEINECNEIILSQIIYNGYLSDLSASEIVALISIFIQESSNNQEEITIESLSISKEFKDRLYEVGELTNNFADKENTMIQKNNIYIFNDWNLNLNSFEAVLKWAKGESFIEVKKNYDSFEGNLIKNILRINNIIREIVGISELIKDHDLYQKLYNIDEILIRDAVTVESLYV